MVEKKRFVTYFCHMFVICLPYSCHMFVIFVIMCAIFLPYLSHSCAICLEYFWNIKAYPSKYLLLGNVSLSFQRLLTTFPQGSEDTAFGETLVTTAVLGPCMVPLLEPL